MKQTNKNCHITLKKYTTTATWLTFKMHHYEVFSSAWSFYQTSLPSSLCVSQRSLFTARYYASAVLAIGLCLSGCQSQVGVLLKRPNVGSHKQHRTIAQGLSFSDAKGLREIRPGSPLRGRQMQVGWVKIGDFRQITGYILKTIQDRRMVSIKLSRIGSRMRCIEWWHCGWPWVTPNCPKPLHFLHFAPPFIAL